MVTTSGFTGTPVSRFLILSLITSSLLASILDVKHFFPIKAIPHLWPYLQFSRVLTFQLAYITSTELLFAVTLLYHLRTLERLWGARKFGSLVLVSWAITGALVVLGGLILKLLTFGVWGYIAPGFTGVVFSLLAVWREEIPQLYGVKIVSGLDQRHKRGERNGTTTEANGNSARDAESSQSRDGDEAGLLFTDKFVTYIMAAQLALSQFPYQLLSAVIGWIVGVMWREEFLPSNMMRWRIPAWVVGESNESKGRGQFEGLRRRLEEEGSNRDGMREVSDRIAESRQAQRRGIGQRMLGYFTSS